MNLSRTQKGISQSCQAEQTTHDTDHILHSHHAKYFPISRRHNQYYECLLVISNNGRSKSIMIEQEQVGYDECIALHIRLLHTGMPIALDVRINSQSNAKRDEMCEFAISLSRCKQCKICEFCSKNKIKKI